MTKFLTEALKSDAKQNAQEKLKTLKMAYLTHHQVGASEATYRILKGMKLKNSNIGCVFVITGFPQNCTTRHLHLLAPYFHNVPFYIILCFPLHCHRNLNWQLFLKERQWGTGGLGETSKVINPFHPNPYQVLTMPWPHLKSALPHAFQTSYGLFP